MDTSTTIFLILDIYESYDKFLSREQNKPLFPVFYEDESGIINKWYFLAEHIKDIYQFIKLLIETGIIKGRVMTVVEKGDSDGREVFL